MILRDSISQQVQVRAPAQHIRCGTNPRLSLGSDQLEGYARRQRWRSGFATAVHRSMSSHERPPFPDRIGSFEFRLSGVSERNGSKLSFYLSLPSMV